MVRYLEIHNCKNCPFHDYDADFLPQKFWGKEVCLNFYHDSGETKDVKFIPDDVEIPDWCPLDGPNNL